MGAAMAANVVAAGFPLTVWNRTPGRATTLVGLGAVEAASPAALAAAADIVVMCVSDTPDVEAVLFGHGRRGRRRGSRHARRRLLDDLARRHPGVRGAARRRGVAPRRRARDGRIGGRAEGDAHDPRGRRLGPTFERARPVLEAMGKTITHFGPVGTGQVAKACNQVILAGTYLAVAEGMVLAMKAGLDPEQVAAALAGGAAR